MLAAASIRISGPSNVRKTRNMGTSQCPDTHVASIPVECRRNYGTLWTLWSQDMTAPMRPSRHLPGRDRHDIRRFNRQDELKRRAVFAVRRGDELPAVMLDDHAANGQPQSRSLRFGREKCIENFIQSFRIDSRAGIFDGNGNRFVITKPGRHLQDPIAIRDVIHRFGRVANEVVNHLLQLTRMAVDERQFVRQLRTQLDGAILELALQ